MVGKGNFVQPYFREIKSLLLSWPRFVIWASAVVIASISGPYDTLRVLGFPMDIVFWSVVIGVGMAFSNILSLWSEAALVRFGRLACFAIRGLIFSGILGTLTWIFVFWFSVGTGNQTVSYPVMLLNFFAVFVALGLIVAAITQLVRPKQPDEFAFLGRLREGQRAELISVSSDDHYVIANTAGGREAIFMRFSDALAELDELDGLQVHRSHWVCRSSIVSTREPEGKLVLVLKDNSEVPVSRRHVDEVRTVHP